MPSTSLSPNLAPMPLSPRNASGNGTVSTRPSLMKRQSSQSSHSSRHQSHPVSPGSVGDHPAPAPRHHVKPRHTKIVLPRNHSSGRNLAKLARQAQQTGEESRRHTRQRSNEGNSEQQSQQQNDFRLPGSLGDDEGGNSNGSRPPTMRRNLTANQLPRNSSSTKLKKNLSHGHLGRLQSGRNLVALATATHNRAPPSPGLKARNKRPRSMEITGLEKDLHAQEVELAQRRQQQRSNERKDSRKKVGFAVGSAGDVSDDEDVPEMEGSGLQEDEWTDQSASASPYSTRQDKADNSRRASLVDKHPLGNADWPKSESTDKLPQQKEEDGGDHNQDVDEDGEDEDEEEDDTTSEETTSEESHSPRSTVPVKPVPQQEKPPELRPEPEPEPEPEPGPLKSQQETTSNRSVSTESRDHVNPTTRRLLNRSQQVPAPALVSNISALDATHTERGSPSVSLQSSRSNLADSTNDPDQDELVSCFVPSTSHPSLGSGANTTSNTPKQGGFHTPDEDIALAAQRREHVVSNFAVGPTSPGSTLSNSSTSATPALGRSRTELRMLQEKALADIESSLERHPSIPAHFYDRRNESLKPYLKGSGPARDPSRGPAPSASHRMGPEIFQGRFRAVNTELRVVQKFRNPIGDAITRLRTGKAIRSGSSGGSVNNGKAPAGQQQPNAGATGLTMSKSTTSLPARKTTGSLSSDPPTKGLSSSSTAAPTTTMSEEVAANDKTGDSNGSLTRGTAAAQSAVQLNRSLQRTGSGSEQRTKVRREVSFARPSRTATAAPDSAVGETSKGKGVASSSAEEIARRLWMEI